VTAETLSEIAGCEAAVLWKDAEGGGTWATTCNRCEKEVGLRECDFCNVVYHPSCLDLPTEFPARGGDVVWACPDCSVDIVDAKAEVRFGCGGWVGGWGVYDVIYTER
jgi:hypothetical protein